MRKEMKWAAGIARGPRLGGLVSEAAAAIRSQIQDSPVDLCLAFVSPHFRDGYTHLHGMVQEHLPTRVFAGCSAVGVIASGLEFEEEPALTLVAARLPDVEVRALYTHALDLPDMDASPDLWRCWLGETEPDRKGFVLLANPGAPGLEKLLSGLDYAYPAVPKVGGLASGGKMEERALFEGPRVFNSGVLLINFGGAIEMDTMVAQGCRPIGRPLAITRCEKNHVLEVDGQPPLHYLSELVEQSNEADRNLMRSALFVGLQPDDPAFDSRGEYLIRNLVGVDYKRGILAVGAGLSNGQLLRFHLRDRASSATMLDEALDRYRRHAAGRAPCVALFFSCVGRGRNLYGTANHESDLFARHFPAVPVGGFFCSGEIGPACGNTHIHTFTSAFALFRPPARQDDIL